MSDPTAQISAAARNKVQAQLGLATSLADTLIDSMQKMVGLNLNAAKASLETSLAGTQRLLTARDPQEFFSLSAHQAQPHAEIALTYGRHLASIASVAQVELTRVTEDQVNRSSQHIVNLIDELGRLTPAGSESTLSLMKSALDNVSASIAQLARNSKIAVETMEHHMKAANAPAPQRDEAHSKQGGAKK
ncbi:MAG: hypothetical protein RL618_1117 [Pseudomonadota bacterium]|jgi:phasin family protein